MSEVREKIVEALARAFAAHDGDPDEVLTVYTYEHGEHGSIGQPRWRSYVDKAEGALAAIAEQDKAYHAMVAAADIARPDPAGEAKP